jgi:hypothetical protein
MSKAKNKPPLKKKGQVNRSNRETLAIYLKEKSLTNDLKPNSKKP